MLAFPVVELCLYFALLFLALAILGFRITPLLAYGLLFEVYLLLLTVVFP